MRHLIALLLLCLPIWGQGFEVRVGRPLPAAGPSLGAFSDDFDRANSGTLGACGTGNWIEAAGDAEISSNLYRLVTGSFGAVTSICGQSAGSLTQYVMVTTNATFAQYPWIVLRSDDSTSPYYAFQLDGAPGELTWYRFDNWADTSGTQIGTTQTVVGTFAGHTLAITITGTGANTDVRVWRGVTGLPSAADTWNGDNTPDATWLTTDPGASAVDTGDYVGIGGQHSTANTLPLDNFFGGGL